MPARFRAHWVRYYNLLNGHIVERSTAQLPAHNLPVLGESRARKHPADAMDFGQPRTQQRYRPTPSRQVN